MATKTLSLVQELRGTSYFRVIKTPAGSGGKPDPNVTVGVVPGSIASLYSIVTEKVAVPTLLRVTVVGFGVARSTVGVVVSMLKALVPL